LIHFEKKPIVKMPKTQKNPNCQYSRKRNHFPIFFEKISQNLSSNFYLFPASRIFFFRY